MNQVPLLLQFMICCIHVVLEYLLVGISYLQMPILFIYMETTILETPDAQTFQPNIICVPPSF